MSFPNGGRLRSLDIFRGATIAAMILVNNPGTWTDVYPPLRHAVWHGWTFTDTVFPFFLWIVGVALTLSTAKRMERGEDRGRLLKHAARRTAILFCLGLFLTLFPYFDFSTIRVPGVLQRIAVCYFIGLAIFLRTSWKGQLAWIIGLNAVYIGLMMFYPTPGCGSGSLTIDCNFARYIDSALLRGHMWSQTKDWDPEGIVSTLPAITTVLFGILAGHVLRKETSPARRVVCFLASGAGLFVLGQLLDAWMPVNKNIWTTSFALLMAGLASIGFGFWYWIADVKGWGRWLKPLQIYGMNAIAAYLFSGVLADVLRVTEAARWLFQSVCVPLASPMNASLLYAAANVVIVFGATWLMYRRGWFLRF